ncbi:hypothetical protein ABW19_dt0203657 [Dactylella cylindrospora]|nr:hypothetical protein ABW19_dt0203657 [Dactylella cylindrospora]
MHTKSFFLAFIVTSPSFISAQRETDTAVQLPACITTCYALAVARANCDTLNPSCICGSNAFFNGVRNCLMGRDGTCTQEEAVQAWNILNAQCADKISSAFPSLVFTVGESVSATMGTIVPDTTESESSISATMGTITGPGETTETSISATMGTIAGPGESSAIETASSQTTSSPSAPTETPNAAPNMIPSVISVILGSFAAGGALFFAV